MKITITRKFELDLDEEFIGSINHCLKKQSYETNSCIITKEDIVLTLNGSYEDNEKLNTRVYTEYADNMQPLYKFIKDYIESEISYSRLGVIGDITTKESVEIEDA